MYPDKYELTVSPEGAVVLALRPAVSTSKANCWDGHPEAVKNIKWVLDGDAGALERYRKARGKGQSTFEALLTAQNHNENAQRTISDLGRTCVEDYVRQQYGDR